MSEQRPLHRLFGLSWLDFFLGSDITVETELDLSLKQPFVDLVLVRKGPGPIPHPLPDGFDDLAAHNLVSFKSHQEALDGWALCELVGHYVNWRKQTSPTMQDLLPEADFRLIAVCVRYPQNLAQQVTLTSISQGVFEVHALGLRIRVIVVHQLPQAEHNAMLHLFSVNKELRRYGTEHYRPYSNETSTLLYQLLLTNTEDPDMATKLEEWVRQSIDELLKKLPPEELLKGLPAEERLKGLPAEERLKGLPAEERLKGLSAEEVANALPPEVLEALQRRLKTNGPSSKPQ